MKIKSKYGSTWDKIVKKNRQIKLEVSESVLYWVYQTLHTLWECDFDNLSKTDKKYIGEFLRLTKSKLKFRIIQ